VRVDGGFIVLNFMKFRDRDDGGAARSKRWRDRQKVTNETRGNRDVARDATDGTGDVTQAEAEANKQQQRKRRRRCQPPLPKEASIGAQLRRTQTLLHSVESDTDRP
jgi:hypothetical protein